MIKSVIAVLAFVTSAGVACAQQDYPAGPIKVVLPIASGGSASAVTRLHTDKISASLGVPVIVEAKPGGGGSIAVTSVMQAPPDGYTVLFLDSVMYSSLLAEKDPLPFDLSKGLQGVFSFMASPQVLAVPSSLGVSTFKELLELAAKRPNGLTYGTQFPGGPGQLLGKSLAKASGAKMRLVSYPSSAQFTLDLVAGRIDSGFNAISVFKPHLESGAVKILAVASDQRLKSFPDVPTMAEVGYPNVKLQLEFGLVARSEVPEPIIQKLATEFAKAAEDPNIAQWIEKADLVQTKRTPAEYKAILDAEAERHRENFDRADK